MKMTKLLASGTAALVAVASLASVASAAEQTFDMGKTIGKVNFLLQGSKGKELGTKFFLTDEEFTSGKKTLGISNNDSMTVNLSPNIEGDTIDLKDKEGVLVGRIYNSTKGSTVTRYNKDGSVASTVTYDGALVTADFANAKVYLAVTGVKGTRGSSRKEYKYEFDNNKDGTWTINAYAGTADLDKFLPEQFLEITSINFIIENAKYELKTDDQWLYNFWFDSDANNGNSWGFGTKDWADCLTLNTGFTQDTLLLNTIEACVGELGENWIGNDTKATSVEYPFMAVTDNGDKTLTRHEINLLSYSNALYATSGSANSGYDGDQSYNDNGLGDTPYYFAGFASQVADFFNKQTNGKITFKFTTATAESSSAWVNGGIPSTQVGIKNLLGDATANDFAMFFNYNQTGSLQAIASVDKDAGEVTFDISNVLDQLNGQTIGVINNIFYGLTKGVYYKDIDAIGLKVETVTLSYDEDDAADIDNTDDTDDTTDDTDDTIDDTIDDTDDTDDTTDDTDDAEDDANIDGNTDNAADDNNAAGDTVIVKPSDDSNPDTGVALAVVPAAIAAAAVVVSKKRK